MIYNANSANLSRVEFQTTTDNARVGERTHTDKHMNATDSQTETFRRAE